MKLSKTGWNNVIILSVMMIILFINSTNNRLFPDDISTNDSLLLPEHSVILTLTINLRDQTTITFERIARVWQMTSQGVLFNLTNQQIEQSMFTWQQSRGLVQADDIVIKGQEGVKVIIGLASVAQELKFTLYPLTDQLLVYNHQKSNWLAFPVAIYHQLVPVI